MRCKRHRQITVNVSVQDLQRYPFVRYHPTHKRAGRQEPTNITVSGRVESPFFVQQSCTTIAKSTSAALSAVKTMKAVGDIRLECKYSISCERRTHLFSSCLVEIRGFPVEKPLDVRTPRPPYSIVGFPSEPRLAFISQ